VGTADDRRFEVALAAWGAGCRVVERLGGGNRNDVRLVRSPDGSRFAARLGARPVAAIEWELRLLDHLRAHDLRVPTALPDADGRRHHNGLVLF